MARCVFCEIIQGRLPAKVIWENDDTLVILDTAGDVDGHMLVMPKAHFQSLFDMDFHAMHHVMDAVKLVSDHCRKIGYHGVNLLHASGACAGQSVPHFHIHLIPRREGDGINAWPDFPGRTDTLESFHKRLKIM